MPKVWIEVTYGGHDMNVLVSNRDSLGQFWPEEALDEAEVSGYASDPEGDGLLLCVTAPPPDPATVARVGASTGTDARPPAPSPTPAPASEKRRVSGQFVVACRWADPEDGVAVYGPFESKGVAETNIARIAEDFAPAEDDEFGEPIRNVFDRLPDDVQFDVLEMN